MCTLSLVDHVIRMIAVCKESSLDKVRVESRTDAFALMSNQNAATLISCVA